VVHNDPVRSLKVVDLGIIYLPHFRLIKSCFMPKATFSLPHRYFSQNVALMSSLQIYVEVWRERTTQVDKPWNYFQRIKPMWSRRTSAYKNHHHCASLCNSNM